MNATNLYADVCSMIRSYDAMLRSDTGEAVIKSPHIVANERLLPDCYVQAAEILIALLAESDKNGGKANRLAAVKRILKEGEKLDRFQLERTFGGIHGIDGKSVAYTKTIAVRIADDFQSLPRAEGYIHLDFARLFSIGDSLPVDDAPTLAEVKRYAKTEKAEKKSGKLSCVKLNDAYVSACLLLDAMEALGGDCTIYTRGAVSPVVLVNEAGEDAIVMPIRIKDGAHILN